jgi:hypothetical protein
LANAIWTLNNDFFPAIKDTPGRIRVVLLIRPDIFAALGIQNQNAKLRDNAALLDWRTTYAAYRKSGLFTMADRLLGSQQSEMLEPGQYWDSYFPYEVKNFKTEESADSSFIPFLRYSFCRPRDIVTMLSVLQGLYLEQHNLNAITFSESDFDSAEFRRRYGEYLIGEIKDHLLFYYTDADYETFLKFFDFLRGKPAFDYHLYMEAFVAFEGFMKKNNVSVPAFCGSPDGFLQILY